MLIKATETTGYKLHATDGFLGTVSDLLFDDASWTLRWLVVETGSWFSDRRVLIPAASLGKPDRLTRSLPVALTMAQVKGSPDIDTHRPVSRQYESSAYDYYGLSPYWSTDLYMSGFAYWGGMVPMAISHRDEDREEEMVRMIRENEDPNLRSVAAVTGYHIHATDGEIGHLADILIDEADWSLRYLIVDTSNWWMGKEVVVSPRSASDIRWTERLISLNVTREAVRQSPGFDTKTVMDAAFDRAMADHYASPKLAAVV